MCFYFRQSKDAITLENRFKAKVHDKELFKAFEKINAYTFPKASIITNNDPNKIELYQWGLIPQWAKDNDIRKFTLNARIETIKEKPAFRNAVKNRCIIPADGFYEWQWLDSKGKQKQPYFISLPNDDLFAFAGLWSEWVDKTTGELFKTYTILTTEANTLMREIHNSQKRMPVILTKKNENEWLNGMDTAIFNKPIVGLKAVEV